MIREGFRGYKTQWRKNIKDFSWEFFLMNYKLLSFRIEEFMGIKWLMCEILFSSF